MFEVGDEVVCTAFGKGIVTSTIQNNIFKCPMQVTFVLGRRSYTTDGYYTRNKELDRNWEHYKITKQEQQMKPQCTTQSEVFEQFTRVSKMIEGTALQLLDVFKYDNKKPVSESAGTLHIVATPEYYTFALELVEDKPVFIGDNLWFYPNLGKPEQFTISPLWKLENVFNGKVSWQEPKRTFMLNGEELPLPDAVEGYYLEFKSLSKDKTIRWDSQLDRDRVQSAIERLLRGESK